MEEETFRSMLIVILDEEFAKVNMKREEWDPLKIAKRIEELLKDWTGMAW